MVYHSKSNNISLWCINFLGLYHSYRNWCHRRNSMPEEGFVIYPPHFRHHNYTRSFGFFFQFVIFIKLKEKKITRVCHCISFSRRNFCTPIPFFYISNQWKRRWKKPLTLIVTLLSSVLDFGKANDHKLWLRFCVYDYAFCCWINKNLELDKSFGLQKRKKNYFELVHTWSLSLLSFFLSYVYDLCAKRLNHDLIVYFAVYHRFLTAATCYCVQHSFVLFCSKTQALALKLYTHSTWNSRFICFECFYFFPLPLLLRCLFYSKSKLKW